MRSGKFVAVGTRAEVGAAAGEDARLDKTFNDKVVIAGFVEQHVHPALAQPPRHLAPCGIALRLDKRRHVIEHDDLAATA
mgnify:CR=1 FL=1